MTLNNSTIRNRCSALYLWWPSILFSQTAKYRSHHFFSDGIPADKSWLGSWLLWFARLSRHFIGVVCLYCRVVCRLLAVVWPAGCMHKILRLFGRYNVNARATYVIVTPYRRPMPRLNVPYLPLVYALIKRLWNGLELTVSPLIRHLGN